VALAVQPPEQVASYPPTLWLCRGGGRPRSFVAHPSGVPTTLSLFPPEVCRQAAPWAVDRFTAAPVPRVSCRQATPFTSALSLDVAGYDLLYLGLLTVLHIMLTVVVDTLQNAPSGGVWSTSPSRGGGGTEGRPL
jgi:hypothetical protein